MPDGDVVPDGTLSSGPAQERLEVMHAEIRRRICLLDYPPGMRLSEIALAAELGTSRTPLRRVLAKLADEGLVRSVQGVGTFVTDCEVRELQQVYELRLELVELTGKLSPRRPDNALMEKFYALARRSKDVMQSRDPRAFTQLDMDHFQTLMQLTENHALREISERLYFKTKRIWIKSAIAAEIDLVDELTTFDREVDDIIAALEVADMAAVASIQKAHISMSFRRLMSAARKG